MHLRYIHLLWLAAFLGTIVATARPLKPKRYGVYNWIEDEHFTLKERFKGSGNHTRVDCNLPILEELDMVPVNNTWIVRLRLRAEMKPKEHAAWAQGLHDQDTTHPGGLRGVVKVYEDPKRTKGNGYSGQFTCHTKRKIEEHKDVLEVFQVVHDLRKMSPDLTPFSGIYD